MIVALIFALIFGVLAIAIVSSLFNKVWRRLRGNAVLDRWALRENVQIMERKLERVRSWHFTWTNDPQWTTYRVTVMRGDGTQADLVCKCSIILFGRYADRVIAKRDTKMIRGFPVILHAVQGVRRKDE